MCGVGSSGYKALKINGLGDKMTSTVSAKHTEQEPRTLGLFSFRSWARQL